MIKLLTGRFCLAFALVLGLTACTSTPKPAPREALTMDEARSAYLAQDYARALPLLRHEAELGNPHAQYTLGYMYYYGQGVVEDVEEALKWIRLAAAKGDARALEALTTLAAAGLRPKEQTTATGER
ncbi:MAG TPA: sel1 repeat family protein [Gammaproteobacteria bacterium]|nr:sel1 repeat family protein [Gammaproteobacteria bacterium]